MTRRVTETSLARTARLLTSKHDIKVRFQPGVCETTHNSITLPTLPDNADEDLVDAMQGYLDQQAGYVLFSDMAEVSKLKSLVKIDKRKAQEYEAFRIVEDRRVEKNMEDVYPGCELNFFNAHYWLYEHLRANWDELSDFVKILSSTFLDMRHPGSRFYRELPEAALKEKVEQCKTIINKHDPGNTAQSLAAAKEILELLDEERREDEEQREDEQGNENDDEGEGSITSPAGMPSKGEGKDGSGPATGQAAMGAALAQASQQEIVDTGPTITGAIEDYQHGLDDGQGYTIFSVDQDSIEDLDERSITTHGDYLMQLREESQQFTSVMRQRLINSLRATQQRRWVGGKQEGRLDARRASRAVLGISQDVYKIRTKKVRLDTAVGLAIDHSGSMGGRLLELAAESAIVLGDVFDPLRIPFMVYGYSTRGYPTTQPAKDEQYLFARWSNLWIRHYKRFDESWHKGALKMTHARFNRQANTLDGESVLYGVKHLLARPEKRKILLVMNDGQPYPGHGHVGRCQAYLKSIVHAATAAGVEIIAFGIRSQNVESYYPNYVLINEPEDLVKEPLKKIDAMLRKGMLKHMR